MILIDLAWGKGKWLVSCWIVWWYWRWRGYEDFWFLLLRHKCVQMGTLLENNFLNIHPKIYQLQKSHHWFLTWNIRRKFIWYNSWQMTRMHTHSNWWTDTRVITWATNRNVRIFLVWHSSKGKVGTSPGGWVKKRLDVPLTFKLCNTLVIDFFVYYFIFSLVLSWTSIILAL